MRREGDTWTRPRTAGFSGEFSDVDITFSPDGSRVFFASERPHPQTADMDIYYLQKTQTGWSEPLHAGLEVNTVHNEVYPTLSGRGNLFFASNRPGGHGDKDIYTARLIDGRLTEVRNLGPAINTANLESDCFVAPDESYILFNSIRPENDNRIQIYVSFQTEAGEWTEAVKLPEAVNVAGEGTGFPTLTPDGAYLLYSGRRGDQRAVFWVSTEVVTEMR
jgi:Tol biopolymer transport system component